MAFTNEQMERYSRHIILQEVGVKGQKKLLNGKVLIIGAGGLGAPAAMYLAAAGVGTIGIVDADEVDLSNLQRQIIHGTADVGICKVGEKGQIVIPKDARDMFNIKPGDSIIVLCDKEKGIALVKSDVIENIGDDILEEKNGK